jgi:hypothetical protein
VLVNRVFRRLRLPLAAGLMVVLAACAGAPTGDGKAEPAAVSMLRSTAVVRSGFACCNLRYSGDQLSGSNYAELPYIPLGTPVMIRVIDGPRAIVEINGKQMSLRTDPAQTTESAAQWLDKAVLADDPRRRLENLPAGVRLAIQSGRLVKGMTKEQVIMSIGYPHADANKGLDTPSWRYWWSSFESFYVHWSRDKLSKIAGHTETVNKLTYK